MRRSKIRRFALQIDTSSYMYMPPIARRQSLNESNLHSVVGNGLEGWFNCFHVPFELDTLISEAGAKDTCIEVIGSPRIFMHNAFFLSLRSLPLQLLLHDAKRRVQ